MITIKNPHPFTGEKVSTETKLSAFIQSDSSDKLEVSFYLNGDKVDALYEVLPNTVVTAPVNLTADMDYSWYLVATDGTSTETYDTVTFTTSPALTGNYYRALHNKIFQAMLDGDAEEVLLREIKRNNNMERTYNDLGDTTKFLEYLDKKAKLLESGDKGIVLKSIGGRHEL